MNKKNTVILAIESSCDDTSAAVLVNDKLLSNKVANQEVHINFGGVVPELASRAHQKNIIPVVDQALKQAGVKPADIDAIAFTRGPGLMGSLLVGTSFAKGFALAQGIPLIDINHLQAHVLALFIQDSPENRNPVPKFPFLCLLVSGGHSQILVVKSHLEMEIIGQTIDDAAGEAFDKCGKVIGLPYPAGPIVDQKAKDGDAKAFKFSKPRIKGLNYSFSGLKTSFLYKIRDELAENPDFIKDNLNNLCASLQNTIVDILLDKLRLASQQTGINQIGIAGGVSANSGLKHALEEEVVRSGWEIYIPKLAYTMDNAAMIGITGYYKYQKGLFSDQGIAPVARM
ncbi:MAG: tRNA (adenosine(37)-N6)-threonylcarbamoyltransferase complex transferase subunit TsaD [Bacteroidetes bacterium]|jgi:N6-L-threonylcarbamoyladenine synthase|nr:tRNA (adenosine(37)-N6)-threonylcarbamoyltransferase complex transferase subunit TsaD [Bacteroidota bacterium]MBT3748325.1 tRNA (adenosine(37)-N6)-threonylcarbamoyltransferase complex transferase subunit TsaD [Bacteroidota bacterium]MBT7093605.1 tRNA (adenosine(37)-N6)-threonylcarbamoyltransferase complex transferase subunit TsaD [Bacteroidota bacterium]MBT7465540.1 tRNA (adenosine(37)-N6)-threonylcarbamoyltransferase complex transferase subunit TsaD [Bacteroidota bacterium]